MLLDIFEENDVEEVPYKSWVMVDGSSLKTITKSTADFVETFAERLKELQRHDFIAKMQTAYMKQIKEGAMENEVILVGDFAENYRFVLQDAAHGVPLEQRASNNTPVGDLSPLPRYRTDEQ